MTYFEQRDAIVAKLLRCGWTRDRALEHASAYLRGVPFNPMIDSYDVDAANRRWIKQAAGKNCIRTMAEIRRWKVDRSSGFLKVVKPGTKVPNRLKLALRLACANLRPDCDPVTREYLRNLAA